MKHRLLLSAIFCLAASTPLVSQGTPGTFTFTGSMSAARAEHPATLRTARCSSLVVPTARMSSLAPNYTIRVRECLSPRVSKQQHRALHTIHSLSEWEELSAGTSGRTIPPSGKRNEEHAP